MQIEEDIGPFGQERQITYDPLTNFRRLEEVYFVKGGKDDTSDILDAFRVIFLSAPTQPQDIWDLLDALPVLGEYRFSQRVVLQASNGLIQISPVDRRNIASDISNFTDEHFFDKSPMRGWNSPVPNSTTVDFTRKQIRNPLSDSQEVRIRYTSDRLAGLYGNWR